MDLPVKFILEVWATLCQMSPYLLFGFLCAGLLSVLISEEKVEQHLGGKGFQPVLKATLFGIPLPLCSCGVIPVFASLRKKGAGKGAATSFLISTPQTGVDSILVTYSLLGPVFAVFRPLAAFVSGIIGGMLVDVFDGESKKSSIGILPVDIVEDGSPKESNCCCHEKKEKCSAMIYLVTLMVSALAFGFILDNINALTSGSLSKACHHETGITLFEHGSAVLLLLLMAISLVKPLFFRKSKG